MTFNKDGLADVQRTAGAFGTGADSQKAVWNYVTDDTVAAVEGAGYFNDAADLLKVGDTIIVVAGMGGTMAGRIYYVASNANGVVAIATFSAPNPA